MEDLRMKIEIGAMVNGVFVKKGDIVKIRHKEAENRNGFYATVTDVSEKRIYFFADNEENEDYFYWNELDFVKLVQ